MAGIGKVLEGYENAGRSRAMNREGDETVIARSPCDEAIQL